MKKSLVIISFAFILLISMSFVSANFFDWLTGDTIRAKVSHFNADDSSRTSFSSGWSPVAKFGGGTCYIQNERGSFFSRFRDKTSCTDADGGQDLLVNSHIKVNGVITNSDYCIDKETGLPVDSGKTVVEYYCDANGKVNSNKLDCPTDRGCLNGVCVLKKVQPTEFAAVGTGGDLDVTLAGP